MYVRTNLSLERVSELGTSPTPPGNSRRTSSLTLSCHCGCVLSREHGPHEEGGGGLLPGAEEGLALVDHLPGGQRRRRPFVVVAPSLPLRLRRPRLQQEPEQVVAVATAAIGGGHPRRHHRRDLAPQQLVQTSHR